VFEKKPPRRSQGHGVTRETEPRSNNMLMTFNERRRKLLSDGVAITARELRDGDEERNNVIIKKRQKAERRQKAIFKEVPLVAECVSA